MLDPFFSLSISYLFFSLLGGITLNFQSKSSFKAINQKSFIPLIGLSICIFVGAIIYSHGGNTLKVFYVLLLICITGIFIQLVTMRHCLPIAKDFYKSFVIRSSLIIAISYAFLLYQKLILGFDTLWVTRLGIDGALYIDGTNSLMNSENVPSFSNIAKINPGGLSNALFNIHHRWGTSILLTIVTKATGLKHPFEIFLPLFTMLLVLLAFLVFDFFKQFVTSQLFLSLLAFLVIINTFFLTFIYEGQWANFLAICLSAPLLLVILQLKNPTLKNEILTLFSSSILTSALLITYSEILPLMIGFVLIITALNLIILKKIIADILLFPITLFFLTYCLLLPFRNNLLTYLKGLFRVDANSIGYSLPHDIYPSDLLGITSIWYPLSSWNTPEYSVIYRGFARDFPAVFFSLAIIFLFIIAIKNLISNPKVVKKKKQDISQTDLTDFLHNLKLIAFFVLTTGIGIYFYFGIVKKSNYLILKSVSFIVIPVFLILAYSMKTALKKNTALSVLLTLTLISGFTNYKYLSELKLSSRVITNDTISLSFWAKNSKALENCVIASPSRGFINPNMRYFDRTYEYVLGSLFPDERLIDPWTQQPIFGSIDQNEYLNSNICLLVDKERDSKLLPYLKRYKVIHSTKKYSVYDMENSLQHIIGNGSFESWQNARFI